MYLDSEFSCFDEAKAQSHGEGYSSNNLTQHIAIELQKHIESSENPFQKLMETDIAAIGQILAYKGSIIKVLDIGGGNGKRYFQTRTIAPKIKIDWHILETPALISAIKKNTPKIPFSYLHEIPCLSDLKKFTHILISNSLQYFPFPYQILDSVLNQSHPTTIHGIPVGPKSSVVIHHSMLRHHGGFGNSSSNQESIQVPHWIFDKTELERKIREKRNITVSIKQPGTINTPHNSYSMFTYYLD